jgi:SAM-dependent methyltransferase
MPTPFDYDADPDRFRLAARVTERHLVTGNLYERIATILDATRVLDIGCGEGALRAALASRVAVVGLDRSAAMLAAHPPPVVRGAADALPFRAGTFGAAVAVNVLDHLPDPIAALREARRVLVAGGLFLAATAARADSPELAAVWRPPPTPFDAEDAPGLVASVFGSVAAERWDAPLVRLPDPGAVRDYLVARFVDPTEATAAAGRVATPLTVTKRGVLVVARSG